MGIPVATIEIPRELVVNIHFYQLWSEVADGEFIIC